MDYRRRIVDDELDELLPQLAAIALEGPKAVGKTATATRRAATVRQLDDPIQRQLAEAEPPGMIAGRTPVLLDEWQRIPACWDLVRRAVDEDRSPGRFLLTGSATPAEAPTHSGAGRIATIRMRPLSLAERGLGPPTVSLAALLTGARPPLEGSTSVALGEYAEEIVGSGFPAIRGGTGRALRVELDGYLERIVERDIDQVGQPIRNEGALRRWLTAYAAASSTTTTFEAIRAAATSVDGQVPARSTAIPYRTALERLWIIDDVPAWHPSRNHIRRLAEAPKHQLADPALAARLLGAGVDRLLDGTASGPPVPRDGTLLGALFESLVSLSVRVYAQAAEGRVSHLRTNAGEHEVDLVVERDDGRVIAFEVKLAPVVTDTDVRHLRWLADTLGDDLLDAAVITTGPDAYRRADGIGVIPAALLGP